MAAGATARAAVAATVARAVTATRRSTALAPSFAAASAQTTRQSRSFSCSVGVGARARGGMSPPAAGGDVDGSHSDGGLTGGGQDGGNVIHFSEFEVTKQVFYSTPLSFALVNLKPLLPGHVLVCPRRVVPRLADLRPDEVSDLFLSVQTVGRVVERAFGAEALTVGCQDGAAAGQSVPHVHVHLIPRRSTDFDGDNDQVYPAMEASEQGLDRDLRRQEVQGQKQDGVGNGVGAGGGGRLHVPSDDERKPRSAKEMEEEARWLASFF